MNTNLLVIESEKNGIVICLMIDLSIAAALTSFLESTIVNIVITNS